MFGRSLTGSARYARTPNRAIAAMIRLVAIGRRMKTSEMFIEERGSRALCCGARGRRGVQMSLTGRRDFLMGLAAVGAVGLRGVVPARANAATTYDPAARFDITVSEVEFRRTAGGRTLMARIYQPKGAGPFPAILDLHGGAWNAKDRHAEEPMDRAVAASGMLVVAIDLTLAPEAPYPAAVQDANYGVRWLKSKAAAWHGDAKNLGVLGSSTGGHIAELLGMRPRDARYNAIALPASPDIDATVAYVTTRSPISDPYARFQQ